MHVTLRGNISAPVQVTDLVEASKDVSLLVGTRKKFLLGCAGSIKGSKDLDSSLVSNESFSETLWPSGWALGQAT